MSWCCWLNQVWYPCLAWVIKGEIAAQPDAGHSQSSTERKDDRQNQWVRVIHSDTELSHLITAVNEPNCLTWREKYSWFTSNGIWVQISQQCKSFIFLCIYELERISQATYSCSRVSDIFDNHNCNHWLVNRVHPTACSSNISLLFCEASCCARTVISGELAMSSLLSTAVIWHRLKRTESLQLSWRKGLSSVWVHLSSMEFMTTWLEYFKHQKE